jgi:hypothetical protein
MFDGSFKTLTKLNKFISITSIKDSSLKMIEFGKGPFIEVISKDVIFPTRLISHNLKFYNSRYR